MGTRERFIAQQAVSLAPLDFVVVTVVTEPPGAVEVSREPDGGYVVRAASPKRPFTPDQGKALAALGLTETDEVWQSAAFADVPSAAAVADRLLGEVLKADDAAPVDIDHGSRRPIVEAQQKLQAMRARIAPILSEMLGGPAPTDPDGDYVVKVGSVEVFVSPMAVPNMVPVVRVFTITNVAVNLTPELGLFLSRVNFTLLFGRFALDTDHRAVWFSESLLGEALSDDELRFTVAMVAQTADEWDDRIAQMFGGAARSAAPEAEQPAPPKPGQPPGGYL